MCNKIDVVKPNGIQPRGSSSVSWAEYVSFVNLLVSYSIHMDRKKIEAKWRPAIHVDNFTSGMIYVPDFASHMIHVVDFLVR